MPAPAIRIASTIAIAAIIAAQAGVVSAGGPLRVRNDGGTFLWSTATPIGYRTDGGPLSATVTEGTARARVLAMFNVWQNVPTSNIRYNRIGAISDTGAFTDGDVSTTAEFNEVEASCVNGAQSPIIYDATGQIFEDLGFDNELIIGFAGPCATVGNQIVSGEAMLNGRLQDGVGSDLSVAEFDAGFIHEFGHFSGLDHSQINLNCNFSLCGSDSDGLPTMFPILLDATQGSLSTDDIAWISRLYPETAGGQTFAGTHGTITGVVYFSDGESHLQFANVIARRVDAGNNEDRRFAVSVVSGYKFRAFHGNPITTNDQPSAGTEAPGDIGLFEIPVPAGNYTVEVESIYFEFVGGSSVGPGLALQLPGGTSGPAGPFNVAAGATVSGVDIILNGTPPRFDQFESE